MSKKVLSFDLGASSGRGIIFEIKDSKLIGNEICRFDNSPVRINGTLCHDTARLLFEIQRGIEKAGKVDAVGIDTWGVDFGLIDEYGDLLGQCSHYRDESTIGMTYPDPKEIYSRTGIAHLRFNSVYQIEYLREKKPQRLSAAKKILFMSDLLAYLLTGEMRAEETMASTTALLNPQTRDFDEHVLSLIGVERDKFAKMIRPGETYGKIKGTDIPLIAVCGHDTASAVVSVTKENSCYISCGTWSLMGCEIDKPIITDESRRENFTNEGGYGGKIRFLKNIMGLWLVQQCAKEWGDDYASLTDAARKADDRGILIDVDDASFETPGNMAGKIQAYIKRTSNVTIEDKGTMVRIIYKSLAVKYKAVLETMERLTGRHFESISMVGGGIKAQLLCEMCAACSGRTVYAGPAEATAMGNAAVLMMALGEIKDISAARALIAESTDMKIYNGEDVKNV